MEPRTLSQWVEMLRQLAPFPDDESASRALAATLEGLGAQLTRDERNSLAKHLPQELGAAVLAQRPRVLADTNEFFRDVASREGVRPGIAIEHAELVCRVLSRAIPFEARARLEHALPQFSQLFVEPEIPEPPPTIDERRRKAPSDLAEGRLGGHRPLSSADPGKLAHRHSVARSPDPHADTKLSSAKGLTQEREGTTLATGRPGSKRPLSDSH